MSLVTKVLMIDDEADFCYFVKKNLMQLDMFDVLVATNGRDRIKMAKDERPDIIPLDLFMPDMPGKDVAAALKEKNRYSRHSNIEGAIL